MKVLTIQRSKWLRGNSYGELLANDGRMCCLGFDAVACGIPEHKLLNIGLPSEIDCADIDESYFAPRTLERLTDDGDAELVDRDVVWSAAKINDDEAMSDDEREAQLIPVLKQLGYDDVQFID